MSKTINSNDLARRKEILDAALYCFLHFGYSKTSMDDVAKKAGLSRPLIYLKFKNKEDLLVGLFDQIMFGCMEKAMEVTSTKGSKKQKVQKIFDNLILEPWNEISGFSKSEEFYGTCELFDSKSVQKFEKQRLKLLADILGDKDQAEVLILAADGQMNDLPTTHALKKRLQILLDHFLD